jgi:hypothetical protein
MMRESRGGDIKARLQSANAHPIVTRSHQHPIDLQPRRIAEGFEARGSIVELHLRPRSYLDAVFLDAVFLVASKYMPC